LQSLSVVRQTMVGHLDTVNCLEMIDSGRLLFSGSEDGTMRAYDSAPFPPDHG
jgi:WD40 repeat protein